MAKRFTIKAWPRLAALVCLLALLAGSRFLAVPRTAGTSENDRIGAPQPGFSGTHQA